jgi:hypothetical protein
MDPTTQHFKIPHHYDTNNPDGKYELVSPPGTQYRLVVFQARGARRRIRTAVTVQDVGHPELEKGVALYLELDKDPVIPLWATQKNPSKWDVAVHYDQGGEQIVYEFQTKKAALDFQSLVTGYDVVEYRTNVELVAVHDHEKSKVPWYMSWKKVSSKPRLQGQGEIQIWSRRSQPGGVRPSGTSRGETALREPSINTSASPEAGQADVITVMTNTNGQRIILATKPNPPLLVAFLRIGEEYVMLKVNCECESSWGDRQAYPLTRDSVRRKAVRRSKHSALDIRTGDWLVPYDQARGNAE